MLCFGQEQPEGAILQSSPSPLPALFGTPYGETHEREIVVDMEGSSRDGQEKIQKASPQRPNQEPDRAKRPAAAASLPAENRNVRGRAEPESSNPAESSNFPQQNLLAGVLLARINNAPADTSIANATGNILLRLQQQGRIQQLPQQQQRAVASGTLHSNQSDLLMAHLQREQAVTLLSTLRQRQQVNPVVEPMQNPSMQLQHIFQALAQESNIPRSGFPPEITSLLVARAANLSNQAPILSPGLYQPQTSQGANLAPNVLQALLAGIGSSNQLQTGPQSSAPVIPSRIQPPTASSEIHTPLLDSFVQQQQRQQIEAQNPLNAERHRDASNMQALLSQLGSKSTVNTPGLSSGIPLALDTDESQLSSYQFFIRHQLEFFVSKQEDVDTNVQGRKKQIKLEQVGIRCRHCADIPVRQRGRGSVYYPQKLSGVYQAAQNMATTHLNESCMSIPDPIRAELAALRNRRDTASGGKAYWAQACIRIGLVEDEDGIHFASNTEGTQDSDSKPSAS